MQRVPDFFIVGQPKAGTTALHVTLRRHPQIFMPELKEPNYFARELVYKPLAADFPTTLDHYLSLFASAQPGQRAGEASIFYLWSHTAAHQIAQLRSDGRIIVMLREPVSFLHSLHLQFIKAGVETEHDLRHALALEEERRNGRHLPRDGYWPQLLPYSEHMRYMDQLRRYQDAFPADQILVLIYDDYRQDNAAILRKILRFLDLDDTVPLSTNDVNQSTRIRARRIKKLMDGASEGRGAGFATFKVAVESITTQRQRRAAQDVVRRYIVYGKPRDPEHDLVMELRRRYKSEVVALSEYLGRDLVTLWGYHDIG
jgi:hypothetical protein